MEGLVSLVGAFVAALCAVLLLRAYFKTRKRLLLWSGLCFAGLTASNALVIVDLQVFPTALDLYPYRLAIGAIFMLVLVFGLVWDSE
ncbi:MAG: DUF5985 family protein [Pseudomonadota bacterium]